MVDSITNLYKSRGNAPYASNASDAKNARGHAQNLPAQDELPRNKNPQEEEYLRIVSSEKYVSWKRWKHTIKTPNIFATNHLFPETRDQYFISSLCAPSTLSTTSSVLASILCICSPCSETIAASCPNTLPSSLIVLSIVSIASPRILIYEFCGCASSIISSC